MERIFNKPVRNVYYFVTSHEHLMESYEMKQNLQRSETLNYSADSFNVFRTNQLKYG